MAKASDVHSGNRSGDLERIVICTSMTDLLGLMGSNPTAAEGLKLLASVVVPSIF
jgi:hypothetical protein